MSVAEQGFLPDGDCMSKRLLRTLLAAAVATGAFAVGAPAANAGLLVASAKNCSPQPMKKAFAPWGDQLDYQLAPGGSFEVALSPGP
jgi:hypothetical protein